MTDIAWASFLMPALVILILPLTGAFMAATPYLMPKRECFAITVPDAAVRDPYLRSLKRRFAGWVLALTALASSVTAAVFLTGNHAGGIVLAIVATFAIAAGSYGLMLRYRSKVRAYKREQGWRADGSVSVGFMGDETFPRPLPLKWSLLYLLPLAATIATGVIGYGSMPDLVPLHIDLEGNVTEWGEKSPGLVAFPVAFLVLTDLCMMFAHWSILRSKKAVDPAMPAASAWAYGMFARAQSVMMLACGLLLGVVGLAIELAFVGALTMWQAAIACAVPVLAVVVGSLALSVTYGQNGSRLISRMSESDAMPVDDDRFWKAGVLYANPSDASLFVPERFGIGWTLNWGRPAAWATAIGFVLLIAALVATMLMLTA